VEIRFNSILAAHGKLLRGAIASYCSGRPGLDVDDILQETYIRVWRSLFRGSNIQNYPSYLHRVAAAAAIDAIRRKRVRREEQAEFRSEPHDAPDRALQRADPQASPEETAGGTRLRSVVRAAVDRLPDGRRQAVLLHLRALSVPEIAGVTGWSEPKTRNLLYRGLSDLRNELRQLGYGTSGGSPS
jgi:RNA polymerase sigma-70 factor, ECF subfamily